MPALVTVVPYRRDGGAGIMYAPSLRWFAARGYACVLVDFQGTGCSDGPQRPPFDPGEADDGVAAVEWAATQPWCDGSVGMWGISYGAILAMRTATRNPPHLKAIAPIMGMLDPERDFVHPAGISGCLGSLVRWGAETLLTQLIPPLGGDGGSADRHRWLTRARTFEPWLIDLFRHAPGDPAWRRRVIDPREITVPALCIAGWRDLFCDATLRAYQGIAAPKRLIVGPWMHTLPDTSPFEAVDVREDILAWWAQWLRGTAEVDRNTARVYVQGSGAHWREFGEWPPRAVTTRWATGDDSRLVTHPVGATAGVVAERAMDATAGALSGLWGLPTSGFGRPLDQHDDDLRSLSCTSDPAPAETLIAGTPTATVTFAAPDEVDRVVVKLTDVDPDGRSTLICAGAARPSDAGAPIRVELAPTCYRLGAGHRLRIVVSDSDFPRLWPPSTSRRLRLAAVDAELPVLTDDRAEPVAPVAPAAPPDEGDAFAVSQPQWQITRDHLNDAITVSFGEQLTSRTPQQRHLVQVRHRVSATVAAADPGSAWAEADSTATVQLDDGRTIAVRARIHLTRDTLIATAHIRIDDHTVLTRTWES